MDELFIEPHLERYKKMFGHTAETPTSATNLSYLTDQAHHAHALAVQDHLWKLSTRVASETTAFGSNRDALIYLRYGAGRRLLDMFDVYRTLIHTAHEGRTAALEHEEQKQFSRDLNTLYINLRGTLDNLAFCLLHECQPDLKLRDMDVGLFSAKFRKAFTEFPKIAAAIERHDEWNRDIKTRRDPAAHRIPLYLPSQMSEAEVEHARALFTEQSKKIRTGEVEEANRLFDRAMRKGSFLAAFLHHPDESLIPIYPTIPNDVGHLIEIGNVVLDYLVAFSRGTTGPSNSLEGDKQSGG